MANQSKRMKALSRKAAELGVMDLPARLKLSRLLRGIQQECHFELSDIGQSDDFPDVYAAILFCGELADPLTHEILFSAPNPDCRHHTNCPRVIMETLPAPP